LKFSFTKIIMAVLIAVNIAVAAYVCFLMSATGDLTPAPYLLMGEGGAISVWLASYAWKERAANKSKYAFLFVKEFAAEHGVSSAIEIARVVLQE
jgi:hypothetical protein